MLGPFASNDIQTQYVYCHVVGVNNMYANRLSRWISKHIKEKPYNLKYCIRFYLFIYSGFYIAFNTVQVILRRVVGRAEETSTFSSPGFLYCKLPTNGKQLPAFPLEAVPGIEPRPQRWEARVLPCIRFCIVA